MNEELQKALAAIILKFAEAMGGATDFALEQAPEVIQQLLRYNFAVSIILCAAVSVPALFYIFKGLPSLWRLAGSDDDGKAWTVILTVAILAAWGAILINGTWFKIWLAPKVYLIEYAASLAK